MARLVLQCVLLIDMVWRCTREFYRVGRGVVKGCGFIGSFGGADDEGLGLVCDDAFQPRSAGEKRIFLAVGFGGGWSGE